MFTLRNLVGLLLGALLTSHSIAAPLPDLIVWGEAATPYIESVTFPANSCEVVEGCAIAGTRKLLRFNVETRNIGTADLVIGNATNNPLFHFSPCHGHYHFEGYILFNLLNDQGQTVATGNKIGFCLEDIHPWAANASSQPRYDCSYQGIQAGWADVYTADLPCQWVDVTDTPPGNYTLLITVDPGNAIPELNDDNNSTLVPVTIPGVCVPPRNDSFAAATPLYAANFPQSIQGNNACATREPGETAHAGNSGGHSVWFRWTPTATRDITINTCGSTFDTLLAVYSMNNGFNVVAENDDIVPQVIKASRVSFRAIAGIDYRIAIDGYDGDIGTFYLNLAPPPNDFFSDAQMISGSNGKVYGWTIGSSIEPGEPSHASSFGLHSVWYSWLAPGPGTFTFDTIGSDFNTALAVYAGGSVSDLQPIASDNNSGPSGTSRLRFSTLGPNTYNIAVSGPGNAAGHLVLNWTESSPHLSSRLTNGLVRIAIAGAAPSYLLEVSSNLVQWTALTNLPSQAGQALYYEPSGRSLRFYRTQVP